MRKHAVGVANGNSRHNRFYPGLDLSGADNIPRKPATVQERIQFLDEQINIQSRWIIVHEAESRLLMAETLKGLVDRWTKERTALEARVNTPADDTTLQDRAAQILIDLSRPLLGNVARAELQTELCEIADALGLNGAALGDPRSVLEAARDLDDAETMATRAGDYPR